ncbi:hypothetical protein [Micromonospora sp. NBC_00421]|uniref:hypothetical protein n=1 Tax=Micromonospora sp. NBC_00421 TaxID=2975976 RepID=UPI002E21C86F
MRWKRLSAPPDEAHPDRAAPATPPLPLALPGAGPATPAACRLRHPHPAPGQLALL